jgi:competence protein ComEA
MGRDNGTLLLVAVLLAIVLLRMCRAIFPWGEDSPVFYPQNPDHVTVYLGKGFRDAGYHHFFDANSGERVIQMAACKMDDNITNDLLVSLPVHSGETLELVCQEGHAIDLLRKFMPAAQRMTLGIPLHPDSMNFSDWQALPGIGPKLAERIMDERQKNGAFGSLQALQRVRGIGPGTIRRIQKFF